MENKASEVITFTGETDGTSATGVFPMYSEVLHAPVSFIRPDKGMKMLIWAKWIAGEACMVYVEHAEDVTVATPEWKKISTFYLSSAGEIAEYKRKPIAIQSRDGKQAVRFTWRQVTAAKSYVTFQIQFESTS